MRLIRARPAGRRVGPLDLLDGAARRSLRPGGRPSGGGWLGLLAAVLIGACAAETGSGAGQGKERGARETPPSARAREILARPDFEWRTERVPGARIHTLPGSHAASLGDALAARVQAARRRVAALLDRSDPGPTLDLFYVESREEMARITGRPVTGFAYREDAAVVLVTNPEWRGFEAHEMSHVLAGRAWGPAARPEAPVEEGLAVLADGDCGGYPVARVVRAMLERGRLADLDALARDFRALPDLVAYLQAGAILVWVHERAGSAGLRQVWREGFPSLPLAAGVAPARLEARWRSWLREEWEPVPEAAWERIEEDGCGVDAPEEGDPPPVGESGDAGPGEGGEGGEGSLR